MSLFGMAFRRVRKLIAWAIAVVIIALLGAGVLYIVETAGWIG